MEQLNAAALTLSDKSAIDPILRFLSIGHRLGNAGYLSLDAITTVHDIGIYKLSSTKRLSDTANGCWAAGLLCNTLANTYMLLTPRKKVNTVNRKEGDSDVVDEKHQEYVLSVPFAISSKTDHATQREPSATRIQLVSDLCDLTIPAAALGVVALDERVVAIAGIVSSLVGVCGQWHKTT